MSGRNGVRTPVRLPRARTIPHGRLRLALTLVRFAGRSRLLHTPRLLQTPTTAIAEPRAESHVNGWERARCAARRRRFGLGKGRERVRGGAEHCTAASIGHRRIPRSCAVANRNSRGTHSHLDSVWRYPYLLC